MAFITNTTALGRRHSLYAHSDTVLGEDNDSTKLISQTSMNTYHVVGSSVDNNFYGQEGTIITLNVGGQFFKTYAGNLRKLKGSRLEIIIQQLDMDDPSQNEIFIDRNPEVFSSILDYCRYDELHIPSNTCVLLFRKELQYWGVSEMELSDCCKKRLQDIIDDIRLNEALAKEFLCLQPKEIEENATWRNKIYDVLEYPETSYFAKVYAVVYYLLVAVTVLNIFLSTVPSFRVDVDGASLPPFLQDTEHTNHSDASDYIRQQLETNQKLRMLVTTDPHPVLDYLDIFCLIFFTIDFILRIITVPDLFKMFKGFFTFCDLMYLIPVWVLWIVQLSDGRYWRQPEHVMAFLVLQCFIVARVVALFQVANQYRALRILVLSLKASIGEILLLIVFVIFGMIVFSSLIYCVEVFITGTFENMFFGLWWSFVTMTTVGYGDMVPKSGFGYLVGCLCAMTGIILIGMVVPIITSNFHKYYNFRHRQEDSASLGKPDITVSSDFTKKPLAEPEMASNNANVSENVGPA